MLALIGFGFSALPDLPRAVRDRRDLPVVRGQRRRDGGAARHRDGQVAASRSARPTCSSVITPVRRPSASTAARPPSRRSSRLASRVSSGSSELTRLPATPPGSRISETVWLVRLVSGTASAVPRFSRPRKRWPASTTGNQGQR